MKIACISVMDANRYCCKNAEKKSLNSLNFGCSLNKNILRGVGTAVAAATIFSAISCRQGQDKTTETEQAQTEMITEDKNRSETHYYYFPKDNGNVNADNYGWKETIYSNGSIVKDSLNYKIYIKPNGERTEIKTEKDTSGNTKVTTTLPDKSRIERTDYKPLNEEEVLYKENYFRSDSSLKESKYYNEYPSDTINTKNQKIVEQGHYYYNEKGVLIKWYSDIKDSLRDTANNEYDSKKRLIYDDIKNEKYKYKGNSMIPYSSTSMYDDCTRVTLYDDSGNVSRIYFKASDGTITEADSLYNEQ